MTGVRIQCLLFIFHERKLDVGVSTTFLNRSRVKGFALIPQAAVVKATRLCELLTQNGFPVLTDDQDHAFLKFTEGNVNAEVIEILLDVDDSSSQESRSVTQHCFVDGNNLDIEVSLDDTSQAVTQNLNVKNINIERAGGSSSQKCLSASQNCFLKANNTDIEVSLDNSSQALTQNLNVKNINIERAGGSSSQKCLSASRNCFFKANNTDIEVPPCEECKQKSRPVTQNCFVNVDNIDIVVSLLGVKIGHKRKGDLRNVSCAIDEGNTKVLERVLRCGANISLRHPKGGTILHLAVKRGHDTFVRMLLTYGADANITRKDGSTALHIASLGGFSAIVENLLEHKADPNLMTTTGLFIGSTPLHFAVRKGHAAVTELLLAGGAHVNAEDFENRTSLTLAVEWRYLHAVDVILNGRLDGISKPKMKALCRAVNARKIEFSGLVTMRLEHALSLSSKDTYNRNVLYDAVSRNSSAVVEHLAKFSSRKCTVDNPLAVEHLSLTAAAGLEGEEILKSFLEYGSDVAVKFDSKTVKMNRLKNVELLMAYGARRDALSEFRKSLLHIACVDGSAEVVEILLRNGIDPYSGEALFVAAKCGHPAVVTAFLEFGVPIELKNSKGQTALHVAASRNKPELVEYLTDHGADIHSKSNMGHSPLSIAAAAGFTQVVEVILRFDARLDFKDDEGHGVMFHALMGGSAETVQAILDYGFPDIDSRREGALSLGEDVLNGRLAIRRSNLRRGDAETESHLYRRITLQKTKLKEALNLPDEEGEMMYPTLRRSECKEEVARMKNETVGSTSVTYYDLLMQDTHRLAHHLGNESIAQLLTSGDLEVNFPLYGSIIRSQLHKGNRRNELIEKGAKLCPFSLSHLPFSQFSSLPSCVSVRILNYLSNQDIANLINAASFNNHNIYLL